MSNAIATRNEQVAASPRKLVEQYSGEIANLLPSHIKSEMFVRASAGALRMGRMTNGEFDLEVAARNNPQAFINALREAARLGLTPGSEEYYLTTIKNRGRSEILGIIGYQGFIELMYRSGVISTVIIETVHEGELFDFVRGRDEHPIHQIDWYAERGELRLVYGYAKFKDGSFSPVIVLNQFDIAKVKSKSASWKSGSESSPWRTDERAMWLKTAVRRLKTWVPTSTERVTAGVVVPDFIPGAPVPPAHQVQIHDPDEVVEAEIVPDPEPPAAEPEAIPEPTGQATAPPPEAPTQEQKKLLSNLFEENKIPRKKSVWLKFAQDTLGANAVTDFDKLTSEQAETVAQALRDLPPTDAEPTSEPVPEPAE